MKSYDTILFDLDGTLINSGQSIFNSLYYTFDKEKIDYSRLDLAPIIGPPIYDGMKMLLPDLFQDEKYLRYVIKIFRDHYAEHGIGHCEVYAGVHEMLQALHAKQKRLIIATSKTTELAQRTMTAFKLDQYFHMIVGSNVDLTRSIKSEIISYILAQLEGHNKQQIVMIGDRRHDMEGAKFHGLDTIGVTYGYGSEEELSEHEPTHLLSDVEQLKKILL